MGEDADRAWDILFMAVVGGVVGAKVYYVLLNYSRLVADPMGMIFSRGGMVWYGGFLLATALVVLKVRRLGLPLGKVADGTALALPLAYAVGRIGCFLVGDDYGPSDGLLGGDRVPGRQPSHPRRSAGSPVSGSPWTRR